MFMLPSPPILLMRLKIIIPENPSRKPVIWYEFTLNLNSSTAKIRVNKGDNAFSIPVSELSSLVWASANNTAGTKLLINPVKAMNFQSLAGILFNLLNANGSITRKAKVIRNVPTCSGVKYSSPFFMRINELPQITDNISNNIHEYILSLSEKFLFKLWLFYKTKYHKLIKTLIRNFFIKITGFKSLSLLFIFYNLLQTAKFFLDRVILFITRFINLQNFFKFFFFICLIIVQVISIIARE